MKEEALKYNPFTLKFDNELEQKYNQETFLDLLLSFRLVILLFIVVDTYLIVVDIFRLEDYIYSITTRMMAIGFYVLILIGSQILKKRGPRFHQHFISVVLLLLFGIFYAQHQNGNMYYLFFSNVSLTLIYINFTVSGLQFRNAGILATFFLAIYIINSFWIYPNPYHSDQFPNMLINFFIAGLVGYLLENNRRKAFVNHYLLTQKNDEIKHINADLKRFNELKNKLLSVVSHDIQSPLNSISSVLALFKKETLTHNDAIDLLGKIETQIGNTIGYVQKILLWTKNQMNGFQIKKESINIFNHVEENIQSFENLAKGKNVKIDNLIDSKISIYADQEMLDIILRNLMTNGIKFSNEGSTIEIGASTSENNVEVTIRDHGVGIEQERLNKLFNFNHAHTNGTNLERGTGIGLSLCAEFMDRLGGELSVKSQINQGSTFSLKFKN